MTETPAQYNINNSYHITFLMFYKQHVHATMLYKQHVHAMFLYLEIGCVHCVQTDPAKMFGHVHI